MPNGWTVMVQVEVSMTVKGLQPMVEGEDGDAKKIYREHPHSTWGNHFSGNRIMYWLGENGCVEMVTYMRYRLPY